MRFDTRTLQARPKGPEWQEFSRAARAGEHGEDLAAHGFRRFRYAIEIVIFAICVPAVPVGLLVMEGVSPLSVSMSTLWIVTLLVVGLIDLRIRRLEHWAPKTRKRYQLIQFARSNGLAYEPSPIITRPAADLFDSISPTTEHLDLLRTGGSGGFRVASYREARDWDGAESYWFEAGYAVVPLSRAYPHTFASRSAKSGPGGLRAVTPAEAPYGYRIWCAKPDYQPLVELLAESRVLELASAARFTEMEIIGDQLFLVRRGGFLPLESPRWWESFGAVLDALSPWRASSSVQRASGIPMTHREAEEISRNGG